MRVTHGSAALKAAGKLDELSAKTGFARSMLAGWRSGRVTPSEATQEKLEAILGIPREAWAVPAQPGVEANEGTQAPQGELTDDADPSARRAWEEARSYRLALERKGAAPRDVTAARNVEHRALETLAGSDDRWARLLRVTAEVLKHDPDVLETWRKAMAQEGL